MCKNPVKIRGYWFDCGKCHHCRIKKAREWTIRILNEFKYYQKNTHFITLTYAPENLPEWHSLHYSDVQAMLHRLRANNPGTKIKFFCVGEYGKKTKRPHYHMLLFGMSKEQVTHAFRVQNVWNLGFVDIGYSVNCSVAQYCAQYSLSKLQMRIDGPRTQCLIRASQGLGLRYATENAQQILDQGFIAYGKMKFAIPRYYFKKWEIDRSEYYQDQIDDYTNEIIDEAKCIGINIWFNPEFDDSTLSPSRQNTRYD